jgi:hypothetical protein
MYIVRNSVKIYCDLDGVLVNFKKGFFEMTGVATESLQDSCDDNFMNFFYRKIEEKNICEVEFWSNLDWIEDGQELWNFIKIYHPEIITAPSYNPNHPVELRYCINHNKSMQGKTKWVERLHMASNLHFKEAMKKHELAKVGRILIDDRLDVIESWRNKKGIGIHHINTEKTISELQSVFNNFKVV